MAAAPLTRVLAHVRSLTGDDLSDQQLLQRYLGTGDEAAFAALVRRHGPLVLGVCRRVLGSGPDPEDAFQATFIVLAKKAATIRKSAAVGSWLYGVAYRVSVKLRNRRQRRQRRDDLLRHTRETPAMGSEPASSANLRELGAILDEELQRLPAPTRDALVLCHLEGLSHQGAAERLGCPLGTVKGRVLRGRELLRRRLQRRGVALSAMALALALTEQARAAVPAALLKATARFASPQFIPAHLAALAEGAAQTIAAGRLKLALFTVLSVGLLGFAAGGTDLEPARAVAAPVQEVAIQPEPKPATTDAFGDPLPEGARARLGTVRWRHGAAVTFIALLPDQQTAVTAANDRFVRVWDLATGKERHRFGPGPMPAPAAGPGVFVVGNGRTHLTAAAVSADGKTVAAHFDDRVIRLWDTTTGKEVGTVTLPKDNFQVGALAFAPEGKTLAIAGVNGTVRLWDLAAGKQVRELGKEAGPTMIFRPGRQSSAAYSPDGKTLVSVRAEDDNMQLVSYLEFWDPETGKLRFTHKAMNQFGVQSPVFSPDGKRFAFANGGEITVLDAATGKVHKQWGPANAFAGYSLVFAADNRGLYGLVVNGPLREWDTDTGKELWSRQAGSPSGPVFLFSASGCLALSPDGKTLALATTGNAVHFLDAATAKEQPAAGAHTRAVQSLAFTPDGKSLVTVGADKSVRHWDTATGKQTSQTSLGGRGFNFAASADGRLVAHDNGQDIIVTDTATQKEVLKVPSQPYSAPRFLFAPDGKALLVRRQNEAMATIYDLATGKERCRMKVANEPNTDQVTPVPIAAEVTEFFFSADSKRLGVLSATRGVTVFDTATGAQLQNIPLKAGEGRPFRGAAFAPDGRTVAVDEGTGVVRIFEVATAQERRVLGKAQELKGGPGMPGIVAYGLIDRVGTSAGTVAFSLDGRLLALAGTDRVVRVFDVATGKELAAFAGHQAAVDTLAFAPDGRSLASGSGDTTALVWNVDSLSARAGPPLKALADAEIGVSWDALASDDAAAGGTAVNSLVGSPKETLALLKGKLRPPPAVDAAAVAKLLDQLDSGEFKARQKAQVDLLALGDQVVPYLAKALAGKLPLETKRRLEVLHGKLTGITLSGERLRLARAVEVLERIGNAEARQLLQTLADGPAGSLETTQARAALARLGKQ
jgi:RNA polymerase sigma factor (sigma-70 family)